MIVVSACLAGEKCRYDGNDNIIAKIKEMVIKGEAVTVCPEVLGGMSTPRAPCEIIIINGKKRVFDINGEEQTLRFEKGAELVLQQALEAGVKKAVLKSRSPSCGKGEIYDGSFSRTLNNGNGIMAEMFEKNGIEVISSDFFLRMD